MKISSINFFPLSSRWAVVLIIVLTVLVYANSLHNAFVGDDFVTIVENDFIKSWNNLPVLFSRNYLCPAQYLNNEGSLLLKPNSGEITYRPVVTLSYLIDYSFWKLNPFGYHLTNLGLHICNAVLFFFLVLVITANVNASFISALLFALHPVNTEAVDIVSFREDLLFFFFYIAAFISYIYAYRQKSILKVCLYLGALILFLLALFSKEMAVTLPLVLFLYDFYFVAQGKLRNILANFKTRYLGLGAALLFYFWIWGVVMRNPLPAEVGAEYSVYTKVLTLLTVIGHYIQWIVFPVSIRFFYSDLPFLTSKITPPVLLSLGLIVFCLTMVIRLYKKFKIISFSIIWFFLTLLPVYNIIPLRHIAALRYLYLPIAGFCILLPLALLNLSTLRFLKIPPAMLARAGKIIMATILIGYFSFTAIRNIVYRNDVSGWLDIVEYYPDNDSAHIGLGRAFRRLGLLDEAIKEFKISAALNPRNALAHFLLGSCYNIQGKTTLAIAEYEHALKIKPNFPGAYNDLGVIFFRLGNLDAAMQLWNREARCNPDYIFVYPNLALGCLEKKQYDLAIQYCDKAIRLGGKVPAAIVESLKPYRK